MKLEERDDEVHHGLDASGRNMILNRATYTCTIITIIITITIITPLTDETEFLLHVRLSTQPSPRRPGMVMFVHSMVFSVQLLCCRPHLRTQSKVPSLLDSLHHFIVQSHMAKPYQLPSLANGTEGFHGTHKTLDLAPHVLICHVFQ